MKDPNSKKNAPITFEIEDEILKKLQRLAKNVKAKSLSEIIRHAIKSFKFEKFENTTGISKQISVRLPMDLKNLLDTFSTKKNASVGELLRVAIKDLCSQSPKHQTIKAMIMATSTPKKAAVRKPAAKKTAAKKTATKKTTAKRPVAKKTTTAKTAAKKRVAKKPVAKKPAKKSTVKKSSVKRAVAKRPTARKTVARKTTAKKK